MADELTGLELRSLITDQGQLRITLDEVAVGEPSPGEVVVRVEAAPINPSDLGLLLGPADLGTMKTEGAPGSLALTASVPVEALPGIRGRFGQALPVGNEGAGV